MTRSLRNWWSVNGPFALSAQLHGPHKPQDKAVLFITSALGIVVCLTVFGGAYIAGGK